MLDAALGMHGAGKYGAQCGLAEGTLIFLGTFGRANYFHAILKDAFLLYKPQGG